MLSKTANMQSLFSELCESHLKLTAYAKQADTELKHNIARMFKALAFSKEIQALNVLKHMGYVKKTDSNIKRCLNNAVVPLTLGENASWEELTEKFDIIEEKSHHIYLCARDTSEVDMDISLGDINVCSKCGYTLPGNAPHECAVCHAAPGYFRIF